MRGADDEMILLEGLASLTAQQQFVFPEAHTCIFPLQGLGSDEPGSYKQRALCESLIRMELQSVVVCYLQSCVLRLLREPKKVPLGRAFWF